MKTLIKLTLLVFTLALQLQGYAQPKAGFTTSSTVGCQPLAVSFSNTSSNAQYYLWDFGNGNASTIQSPSIIYQTPGNYTVKLVVKDSIGNTDSIVQVKYITVLPNPAVNFNYTVSGTCAGNVNVKCTNLSDTANAFLWSFGDGITSSQMNPTYTYNTGGSFSITLKATSPNGCVSTYTHPQTVIVRNNPSAQFTISSSASCDSNQVFTYSPAGSGITAYSWTFGDNNASNSSNPSHNYHSTGKFSVKLVATNQWGCTDTVSKQNAVTIFKPISPIISTNKTDGCPPLAVSFKQNNIGITNTQWNIGSSISLTGDSVQHTFISSGTYNYSIQFTDSNGCNRIFSNIDSIIVHPLPAAAFTANKLSGCLPLQVNFVNQSSGANSYIWTLDNGITNTQQNPVNTYTKNKSYPIELKAISAFGCTDIAYDTIRVLNVVPKFKADIQTGCAPLDVKFIPQTTGITNWSWSFGDGGNANSSNPTHTYQNLGNYNVCVTTKNTYGCVDSICESSYINVQNPTVPFGAPVQFNECTPFDLTVNPGNKGNYSWYWDFGDGTTSNNKLAGHVYNKAGTYKVYLTSFTTDSCKYKIQYATVTISSGNADFSYTITNCAPATVQFSDSSVNAMSWNWNFGDGTTSSAKNPIHTYSIPGIYLVTLTVKTNLGCSFTKSVVITTFSSSCPPPPNYSPSAGPGKPMPVVTSFKAVGCIPYTVEFAPLFPNATNVVWDFGDGATSNSFSPSHSYNKKGVYTLRLIAQLPANISDTLIFANSIIIGGANATFNTFNPLSCRLDSITAIPVDTTLLSYNWNWGNGDSSSLMIGHHSLPLPDLGYPVSLKATDSLGCTATKKTLVSWSYPFNEIHMPDSICYNHPLTIIPQLPAGYSYKIDYGDGYVSFKSHAYQTPGKYLVSIVLTDSAKCSMQYPLDSIVVWKPSLTVIGNRNYCLGDTIHLEALEKTAISYSWQISQLGSSYNKDFIDAIASKTGQFDLDLKINKNGCTVHKLSKLEINVQKPQADFQYAYRDMCIPTSVQLTDTNTNNLYTYNWISSGNNTTGKTTLHIINKFPSNVTVYVQDSLGCSDTLTKTLTKPAPPVATVNKYIGCAGDTIHFGLKGSIPKNTRIQWYFKDGNTAGGVSVGHIYAKAGRYMVYAIVNYNNTCTDTISILRAITIGAPKAGILADTLTGCAPFTVDFKNQSNTYTTLLWSFGDGSNSSLPDPKHIYSNPGKYYVALTAKDTLGCSDTSKLSIPVVVLGPTAKFDFSDSSICVGTSVAFKNRSVNYNGSQWFFGDGQTSVGQNPTVQFNDTGLFVVSLIVNDSNGCKSFYTDSTKISVRPVPQANIHLDRLKGCAPLSIQYRSVFHTDSIAWNLGNGQVSALDSGKVQYMNPGTYMVELVLRNKFGCTDTADVQTVEVYGKPKAAFTVNHKRNCYGTNVQMMAKGDTSYHYTWIVDNIPVANGSTYQYIPAPGWHNISLITQNHYGCTDTVSQLKSFFVHDTVPVSTPQINRVSVESDTSTIVEWSPVLDPDLKSYQIFRAVNGGPFQQIANVNSGTLSYVDRSLNTLANVYGYKIVANDSCDITSTESVPHYTINISASTQPNYIDISWTAYKGAMPTEYTLYRKGYYDSTFTELATVSSTTTAYRDSSIACTGFYSYKVIAQELNKTVYYSVSDTATAFADGAVSTLSTPEIIRATVIEDASVYLEWKAENTPAQDELTFELLRSVNDSVFMLIAVLPYHQRSYTDQSTDVHGKQYTYIIKLNTSCGFDVSSNKGSSLLLNATDHQNKEILFRWNAYDEWDNGVERYELQELDESGNWVTVKTSKTNTVTIEKK